VNTAAGCTMQVSTPIDLDRLVEVIRHVTLRA